MNKLTLLVLCLLFNNLSECVFAQPAFKLSGYSYAVLEDGRVGDTIKLQVKVFDKDSLLLFDTLWNHRDVPVSMIVTVYDKDQQKKSRYTKAGDKFEQNILFVRDPEGRLIEEVVTGSDSFRLKTIYQFGDQGRVEKTYLVSGPFKNRYYKSVARHYYNEKGQEIAQEAYVGKKLWSTERKEYDEQGRIIKWTSSESGSSEKIREHFEYDSNGSIVKLTHYVNDTLDFIKDNKWSGILPESSQVHYYLKSKAVEYIFFRKESIH